LWIGIFRFAISALDGFIDTFAVAMKLVPLVEESASIAMVLALQFSPVAGEGCVAIVAGTAIRIGHLAAAGIELGWSTMSVVVSVCIFGVVIDVLRAACLASSLATTISNYTTSSTANTKSITNTVASTGIWTGGWSVVKMVKVLTIGVGLFIVVLFCKIVKNGWIDSGALKSAKAFQIESRQQWTG
jgi:hypothetical protein